MTAAVTPLEARCEVCLGTGSKERDLYSALDCTACEAATERVALMRALKGTEDLRNVGALTWRAYQLGKAAAAPVVPVAAQPVAYMQRHIKVWMRIGGFQRESAWHPVTREEAEGNMENMRRGHLLPGQFEFQPLYAAPSLEAQPAGEVDDTKRLDFMLQKDAFTVLTVRDGTIRQYQLMNQDEDEDFHVLSGEHRYFNSPREAIDAAMAQGDKA
jgi:hypothetical protein